jgi:hypothetical protein
MGYVSAAVYTALCGMIRIQNFPRGARGLRVMWLCEEMSLPYEVELVSFPPSEAYRGQPLPGSLPAYLERTNSRPAYQRAQLRCRGAAPDKP